MGEWGKVRKGKPGKQNPQIQANIIPTMYCPPHTERTSQKVQQQPYTKTKTKQAQHSEKKTTVVHQMTQKQQQKLRENYQQQPIVPSYR